MSRKSLISLSLIAVSLVALTIALPALGQPPSQPPGNSGGLRFLAVVGAGDEQSAASEQFQDVPGLNVLFSTTLTGCVAATASVEVSAGVEIFFRALLDGSLMDGHGLTNVIGSFNSTAAIRLGVDGSNTGVFSYTFTKCNVSRGSHTLAIQWAPDASSAVVRGRTLVVVGS